MARESSARARDPQGKTTSAGHRVRVEDKATGVPAAIQAMQSQHGNRYVLKFFDELKKDPKCMETCGANAIYMKVSGSCGGGCSCRKGDEEEAQKMELKIHRAEEIIQKKSTGCDRNIPGEAGLVKGIMARKGSGTHMDRDTRSGMERFFGRDFGQVRIHTDSFAGKTAHDLRAEAFTIGHDVFFNSGRFNPQTTQGKQLMAHELTHVVQQTSGISRKKIQFWSYGAGSVAGNPDFLPVPNNHRPRVNEAMKIIEDKMKVRRCNDYFTNNTTTGETGQQILNRARIWEYATEGSLGVTAFLGSSDVSYDAYVYRMGKWDIASTLLHEMMHSGGQNDERTCEMAPDQCYVFTPFTISGMSPASGRPGDVVTIRGAFSVGPSQGPNDRIMFGTVDAGRALSWVYSHAGTSIRVRVPAGLSPGDVGVVIINNNVRSSPRTFTVLP
ncbi:MAG: hypothetical protein A4E53_02964 [Pelotomaculum sp. PtaB.Bin104]|nr:MAG: hypothetical protein A4E53_02964 [Pelotomaculum sp. PtaB.Bin104]